MVLNSAEIVEFLDDHDELEPTDESPWPSYAPENGDLYPVDWHTLFGASHNEPLFDLGENLEVTGPIREMLGRGAPEPGSEDEANIAGRRPEVCAWYQPIHFHGLEWGIFIREDCLLSIAADIARFVDPRELARGSLWPPAPQLLRMAFATLFLHEAFHHKTESFAIRLHVTERTPCYRTYWKNVYEPALRPSGGGPLEEALANADSFRRLGEATYKRFVDRSVLTATREYLQRRFPLDPPGYRDAVKYLGRADNDRGQWLLKSQVQERRMIPRRSEDEWRLAPNMNEGLFGLRSNIWTVVRRGARPVLPTFPLYRPVATTDLVRALRRNFGYERTSGGKGSHIRLRVDGRPPLTIPGGRKDLSPPVLRSIAKALGFGDTGALLTALGL